jgi:hypothetical protein
MNNGLNARFPATTRAVFELRYRQGFTFLDRCGRTINTIQEYYPEWIVPTQPTPQASSLINATTGCKFNFNSFKLDIGIDRSADVGNLGEGELDGFTLNAEELTSIVIDELGLVDFTRIGCRVWYLFPAESMADAHEWLTSLDFFSCSPNLTSGFSGTLEGASGAFVITAEDRKFRIAFEPTERPFEIDLGDTLMSVPSQLLSTEKKPGEKSLREKRAINKLRQTQRQKNFSKFAVSIDVDVFQEFPAVVNTKDFVTSSLKRAYDGLLAAAKARKAGE